LSISIQIVYPCTVLIIYNVPLVHTMMCNSTCVFPAYCEYIKLSCKI